MKGVKLLFLMIPILVCACNKEDEETARLEAQITEQNEQISRLEAGWQAKEKKLLAEKVEDPTSEIEQLKAELKKTQDEITSLEGRVQEQRAEQEKITEDFEIYQRKYPIRN